ncbi:MAG TPA: head-tail connector protein [Alphaproteobacteria bacterium]|nr:head-tail connector protein [Alphaproteobacteria bacterium]
MTALVRTTAPAEEPVSLIEAKAHLRISVDDDDDLIESLITGARLVCEDFTRRALITQGWRLWLDGFPGAEHGWWDGMREMTESRVIRRFIHLPRPPLVSVSSVNTYDDDSNITVFDSSLYFVDTASVPGRLALRNNASWPCPARRYNGVRIDFTAGYGAAADVPQALKQGLLAHIAFLYENRGDGQGLSGAANAGAVPSAAMALYQPYRVTNLV